MVGDIDPNSGRPFIKVNHPAPTDTDVGTIRHRCQREGESIHV